VANQDTHRRGGDYSSQQLIVGLEAFVCCNISFHPLVHIFEVPTMMISTSWHAKLKFHHVLLLGIHKLSLSLVLFAAAMLGMSELE
jgi:hypothetical protein